MNIDNFITEEAAENLLVTIDQQVFDNQLKRRTLQYGKRYVYKTRTLEDALEIPEYLSDLKHQVEEQTGRVYDQVIINEYQPGECITKHIDNIQFFGDTIAIVSLCSDTFMTFSRQNCIVKRVHMKRNSLTILKGEDRYRLSHEIKGKDIRSRRISITFRALI